MTQDSHEALPQMLRPARHGNVFEETIERLLQNIKLGLFAVGSKLPAQRELADSLGVSRSTLRDALVELQKAGYIEVQRGRYGGAYVRFRPTVVADVLPDFNPKEVEDVLTFRGVLEPAAASLAAGARLSAAQRSHLLKALDEVSGASTTDYRPKDARFHVAIAEVVGSPSLAHAVADVRSKVSDLLDRIPLLEPNLEHSNQQHQDIVDAILSGDMKGAERASRDHLHGTASLLRGFLGPT